MRLTMGDNKDKDSKECFGINMKQCLLNRNTPSAILVVLIFITFSLVLYIRKEKNDTFLYSGLHNILHHDSKITHELPSRIQNLIDSNDMVIGNKLRDVKIDNHRLSELTKYNPLKLNKRQFTLEEITSTFNDFMEQLSNKLHTKSKWSAEDAWEAYRDLVVKTLYPWDQEYLKRMPERKMDDSMLLSIVSYRDDYCLNTLREAYGKADRPDRLFVALVQQNCKHDCIKIVNGTREKAGVRTIAGADQDCHQAFCETPEGKEACEKGQIRSLFINAAESLGPYAARFFASKLWFGETWFLQIDSHMTFLEGWDKVCIDMLKNAPTAYPVVSHYPPPHYANLTEKVNIPGARLCGPRISKIKGSSEIIILRTEYYYDKVKLKEPRFAPFVGAGFFLAHSRFLKDVPFDPFLPWVFNGEEIILSARLWTHGYDIYSPTQPVLTHRYKRRDQPKFWESLKKLFVDGDKSNSIGVLVLGRIKSQLGYPESSRDFLMTKSLFTAIDDYTFGTNRTLHAYLEYCGLNFTMKEVLDNRWCDLGIPPKGFEQYTHLYPPAKKNKEE